MGDNEQYLSSLKADVEARLQRGLLSPKDFEHLCGVISDELNERVSVSTLKRLWGYSKYMSSPSVSILSTLCRFVGYLDWEDYKTHRNDSERIPSAQVLGDKITVAADLMAGDRIRLTWSPQRVCEIEYLGNSEFVVLSSRNSGIKADDRFCCSLIVSGEPLWLNNLRQVGKAPVAYVCGKQGGVRFEILNDEVK